ncbi:hypothetical protein WJX74_010430 [Apatococcus lobatus]|uniref:glycerol-1-phosphatase n=1 Tax=Apatococcus lobatus TaxID=904363 RepID=A0AAW1R2H8_9CHLO
MGPFRSPAAPKRITHCIFDMDGLLLATETMYTVAQQEVLDPFGKAFNWDIKAQMTGKKALEACQALVDYYDIGDQITPEEFLRRREVILDKMFLDAELMPGVARLLGHLTAHQIPTAVATSSSRKGFDLKTTQHRQLFDRFEAILTGESVTKGKPEPDIYLLAASTFRDKPAPEKCLVFEDAPVGITAGTRAGMQTVMVPDPQLDPKHTLEATEVLQSLEDFQPELWGLPAYPSSSS